MIAIPLGKTTIDKFVPSTNQLCKISKYVLYVKQNTPTGTFQKFVTTSKATPYVFDETTGKLDVDLSLGIIDHSLKISVEITYG